MRFCGSCSACCIAPSLEELKKPCWTDCEHLQLGHGCSIYDKRPKDCRTFRCAWLDSPEMPFEFRPDLSGFMLVGRENKTLEVWELTDERWEGSAFQIAVEGHDMNVKIVRHLNGDTRR